MTRVVMDYSMAPPCLQSLVMCGSMFKHNWNDFCLREQYSNINIVYEHTYFSIFIMIPLFADAYGSRTSLEYVVFV